MANLTFKRLFGRRQIFTSVSEIDIGNVVHEIVERAYLEHLKNRNEIVYLYRYYKGDQPILYRQKSIREDIKNCIVENRANEIVNFKVGYLVGNPVQYISRNNKGGEAISEAVDQLNDYMLAESKASKDKELVEWQMICGTAFRMVLPIGEYEDVEETPFHVYTPNPTNTFVVYANEVDHRPLAGVYYTTDIDTNLNTYSVYTDKMFFKIVGDKVVESAPHSLGMIPIIEYPANNARLGAFEPVLPLLDAINTVDSNRLDGVEQFVQSLIVLYNAELPEGEDANSLQQRGLIVLKSSSENKADIKLMNETLSQSDTQTLKTDMYDTVREIVGIPSQGNGSTGDSSNNGAVILKNGWSSAEARAKDSELMFQMSERQFLKLVIRICKDLSGTILKVADIEAHFTRRNYEDINAKASVLTMLLGTEKVAPKLCFEASNLFIDSEEAYQESKRYVEEKKREAEEKLKQQALIAGNDNGEDTETEFASD